MVMKRIPEYDTSTKSRACRGSLLVYIQAILRPSGFLDSRLSLEYLTWITMSVWYRDSTVECPQKNITIDTRCRREPACFSAQNVWTDNTSFILSFPLAIILPLVDRNKSHYKTVKENIFYNFWWKASRICSHIPHVEVEFPLARNVNNAAFSKYIIKYHYVLTCFTQLPQ